MVKECFVPSCKNDTENSPNKLFVRIREDFKKSWCQQAKAEYFRLYLMYCCEDHFDPHEDLQNYFKWKLMNDEPKFKPTAMLRNITSVPQDTADVGLTVPQTSDAGLNVEQPPDVELNSNDDISSDDDCSTRPEKLISSLPARTSRKQSKHFKSRSKERTERNSEESASSEQPTVACNKCDTDIIGPRLVCVECCDVTICAACDAYGAHAHHYMLRVPAHKPPEESLQLLEALRREFGLDDAIKEDEPLIIADTIKEEKSDPLEDTVRPEEPIEPLLDNVKEESVMLDIVKEESEVVGETSCTVEDCMVRVTPAVTSTLAQSTGMPAVAKTIPVHPTVTPAATTPAQPSVVPLAVQPAPAQPTINFYPSLGVPMLVLHPLSVKQRLPRASKRPSPSPPPAPPPAVGPSQPLTAADTIAGRFDVFSHNTASAKSPPLAELPSSSSHKTKRKKVIVFLSSDQFKSNITNTPGKARVDSCFVPMCPSTSTKFPNKLFLTGPTNPVLRKKWFQAVMRDDNYSPKTIIRCCEDHFDKKEKLKLTKQKDSQQ